MQQIIALLLAVLLIFSSKIIFSKNKEVKGNKIKKNHFLLLFISSFLVQALIISTGGFYSPFLIVLHLYTLGASFLLISKSSISFLGFSVGLLVVNILLNPQMLGLFQEDPGPVILYFVSFVVIIPLAQFLMYSYHIKDALSKILKEYIQLGEKREESILRGLSELVVVTDKDLNILSTNEAAEEALNLPTASIIRHPLLNILPLTDGNGSPATRQALSIDKIIADRATRIIDGFYFHFPAETKPHQVDVQIRPITDSSGEVDQIVVIVRDALAVNGAQKHTNLELAKTKRKILIEDLRKAFIRAKLNGQLAEVEVLNKVEEDILLATEIEDHPLKAEANFQDIAILCKQTIASKLQFAQSLGVHLQFALPKEEVAENALLNLSQTDFPKESLPGSTFTITVDRRWLEIAIQKLLDITILISSQEKNPQVLLSTCHPDDKTINIAITTSCPETISGKQQNLLTEYYGDLGTNTGLSLGSGLEGFIAKTITDQLSIPLIIKVEGNPLSLTFLLTLSKVTTT